MTACAVCGSHAINHHCHGRDGSDPELCDVCYWRTRAKVHKEALDEWLKKTDWVQETAHFSELGVHRADALKARIKALGGATT